MEKHQNPTMLWKPSEAFIAQSNLAKFQRWLEANVGKSFHNYQALWQWSIDEPTVFWKAIWDYFQVRSYAPYTEIISPDSMPYTQWFKGSTLNYAEHLFRHSQAEEDAIIFKKEGQALRRYSWREFERQAAGIQNFFKSIGLKKLDRVVAYIPNIPEASMAMVATVGLGAIWSSCSPDFGLQSVIDRFKQIQPKVLVAANGYSYNGKSYDRRDVIKAITTAIPSIQEVILIPYEANIPMEIEGLTIHPWATLLEDAPQELEFLPVPFDHPIWILYSSGTTGAPKAITHRHGGMLLEHYKYLAFHNDVHPGERFFWYSTTGWMMWNFVHASMLLGATIVLFDGSPAYPDLSALWALCEEVGIQHFGTSAPFLVASMKNGLRPGSDYDLSQLRSIGSTGSPLPPEAFAYVYQEIKPDVWLCSMSGGTDVCSAFVGGCPTEPVFEGEIQCRTLGCAMYAFNDDGNPVLNEVGEMVITKPMPSMPVYFWNDPDKQKYLGAYFDVFPGLWRHGDWIRINPSHSLVILGRSDATLNRQGVRIGTAEIYRALNHVAEIADSLIVNIEQANGDHYMPLFVVLKEDVALDEALQKKIKKQLRQRCSPRHVPDEIIQAPDIPYTISGKKMEAPVKKLLMGKSIEKAANKDSMRNPECLLFYQQLAGQRKLM